LHVRVCRYLGTSETPLWRGFAKDSVRGNAGILRKRSNSENLGSGGTVASKLFDSEDQNYLNWVRLSRDGTVANIRRRFDSAYVILHQANCHHIAQYPQMEAGPGGFTERSYLKIYGDSREDIESLLRRDFAHQGGFTKECASCKPI